MLLPRFEEDVDPLALYGADERAAGTTGAWVLVNMIATADGATAVDGVSGPLGGAPDKRVFAAVRSVPDVILVAAARCGPSATARLAPPTRFAPHGRHAARWRRRGWRS